MNKVEIKVIKQEKGVYVDSPIVDNRVNNTGRPVNKKSTRQIRLRKQALYSKLHEQFVGGNKFYINNNEHNVYVFHVGDKDGKKGCIANADTGLYVCNVNYVGRTKVEGFTYVLGRKINVTINLKEVTFIK